MTVNNLNLREKNLIANNLVYMKDIKVQFGNVVALDSVEFRIGRQEIVGLLGDNGAGKSTLVKALIGLYPLNSGEIYFSGRRVNFSSPWGAREAGIETVYQDLALIDRLSISRNFFLGRELVKRIGPFRFLDGKRMDRIAEKALAEIGLKNLRAMRETVSFLSGGERQAIAIGRANYFGARLLILDEPTAALSETETEMVLRLVKEAKRKGLSVIFITHKAYEVFEVADRFVVLHRGRNYAEIEKEDTNLKELEKLLISSRLAAVKEMAAGVAHQIRNPLGIIKVSAEMLRDDFKVLNNQENYHKIINTLINKVNTLNQLVSNFLDFARPPKLNRTLCSVRELLEASLASLPLDKFPGVKISLLMQEGTLEFSLDRNLMEQVIANLVINAVQASVPAGKVEIRTRLENNHLCIEVQDWGCGLDEEIRKQIFNPFFTTKTSGTGLGLSIVHRIVELHNGSIKVKSASGKGSTFQINL
ncbi:MAG: ATP-binding cassette domain-containing protein [Spirochaetota bacterium]